MGVVAQGVAVSAEKSGRQGESDGVAAVQDGGQDAVAVVEEAETGVVPAPVDAVPLLALSLGQDSTVGLELLNEPVELLAGHAGQSRMVRCKRTLSHTRTIGPPRRLRTAADRAGRQEADAVGNLAAADLSQITRAVKRKLKMLQYRPEVIDGCLAGTDLALDT